MSEQNETQTKPEGTQPTKRITTGKGRGRPRKDADPNAPKRTPRPRVAKIAKPSKRAPRPKTKILRGDKLSVEARAFFSGLAAAWKREKGGTHRELGEKTGVGSSRIDALVHGKTDVRISMIAAIAREAFGVDIKTYVLMGIVYQEQHAAEDAYNAAKERAGMFQGMVGAMPAPAVSAPPVEVSTPA